MAKTTIRNAPKPVLLDYIATVTQDWPDHLTIDQLRRKARECERKSGRWFGGHVSFEDWANL
jgi:hypothetical protein